MIPYNFLLEHYKIFRPLDDTTLPLTNIDAGPPEPGGARGPMAPQKILEINTKVGTGPLKVLKVYIVVAPQRFLASVGPAMNSLRI